MNEADFTRYNIDRLSNNVMGYIAESAASLQPADYRTFLLEVMRRLTDSLEFIGAVEIQEHTVPTSIPLCEDVRMVN